MKVPTVGKNDPCPCLSGKKYRQCCWLNRHEPQVKKPALLGDGVNTRSAVENGQKGFSAKPKVRIGVNYEFSDGIGIGQVGYCFELNQLFLLISGLIVSANQLEIGMEFYLEGGTIAIVTKVGTPKQHSPPNNGKDANGNSLKRVIGTVKYTGNYPVMDLVVGTLNMKTTPGHLFYSVDRRKWLEAELLKVGELVETENRIPKSVTSVTPPRFEYIDLYNVEVEDFHTYFVGKSSDTAVWTHNGLANGGCAIPKPAAVQKLAKAFEHRHLAKDFNEARSVARGLSGVGDDAVPFISELGPHKGKTVGRMSPDGTKGWRIDLDPNDPSKGFHVNWWDRSGGRKRAEWIYGYSHVEGGSEGQFLDLLRHAFGNVH